MAHSVFRQSLTAGVALAGAGAIAFSTLPVLPTHEASVARAATVVQPVVPPRVVTTEIEYVALVNALQTLAAGAAGTLGQVFASFTTQIPALNDYIAIGVPGGLWEDADNLRLTHSLFGNMLFAPIAPVFVGAFTDAVVEVVAHASGDREDEVREKLTESIDYAFARLVGPIISAIGATGAVHQEIYRAGTAGNPQGQWLALLRAPGVIIDAFLNGGYGDVSTLLTGEVGGDRVAAPGLFTPWGEYPEDRSVTDTFPPVTPAETARVDAVGDTSVESGQLVTLPVAASAVEDDAAGKPVEESATPADESTEPAVATEETAADVPEATEETDSDTADKAEREERKTSKADRAEKADLAEKVEKAETSAKAAGTSESSDKDSGGNSAK
ncbi:hypothetical protein [Mycolicibacterium iranicum]|uniref:Uncharacterized protein n=1 Tax=Mycolicibacterium iranicum TaxID=912594 RepID=A0A178LP49_MYCIR|nr:hypothetical protein [Mycolicibacterium iranicum]OAN33905.1 hypothetical protein A4X20_27480 [Mycolicibacterium iranicum]